VYNSPDVVFLAGAAAALMVVVVLIFTASRQHRYRLFTGALLWTCFAAGLLLQALAPRLLIENNLFVVPEIGPSGRPITDPVRLVQTERRMQLTSATCLILSCIGLAVYYRIRLFAVLRRV
jgi:hypothetical protein